LDEHPRAFIYAERTARLEAVDAVRADHLICRLHRVPEGGTKFLGSRLRLLQGALGRIEEDALLDVYFERRANEALWRSFDAMKIASALREAMWGMVSELHLHAPGVDYVAYAEQFLARFEALLAGYQERYGKL